MLIFTVFTLLLLVGSLVVEIYNAIPYCIFKILETRLIEQVILAKEVNFTCFWNPHCSYGTVYIRAKIKVESSLILSTNNERTWLAMK